MTTRRTVKLLVAAALLMAVVIALWSHTMGSPTTDDARPGQPQSRPSHSESPLRPQLDGSEAGNPAGNPDSPPAESPAASVVNQFAKAFVSAGSHRQWLSQLRPLVSDELLEGYRYTSDRSRPNLSAVIAVTPRTAPTDNPQILDIGYASGLVLRCTVIPSSSDTGNAWRISGVAPQHQPGQRDTDPGAVSGSNDHA